mgnify:CR=1 FL=1
MKWIQSYNNLVQAIVIGVETLLCGIVFVLFYEITDHTSWGKVLNAPRMQIGLTLLLCDVFSGMARSVWVCNRLCYALQIVAGDG